jgi:hypothetical protein
MKLACRIIQFMPDPMRQEGRNVAVFGHDGEHAYVRALGLEKSGVVSLAEFASIAGKNAGPNWVYGEWVNWLQDLAGSEGREWPQMNAVLDAVNLRGVQFTVTPESIIESEDGDPEQAMDWLADRMIDRPRLQAKREFSEQVEDVLSASETRYLPGFIEGAAVDITTVEGAALTLRFPYLVDGKSRIGIRLLKPTKAGRAPTKTVADAIYAFRKGVETGFLERSGCIVLTAPLRDGQAVMDDLASVATVLDVTDDKTSRLLLHLVRGDG